MDTAFVLSGGAGCGAARAYMAQDLVERGAHPDVVAGAVDGTLIAGPVTRGRSCIPHVAASGG